MDLYPSASPSNLVDLESINGNITKNKKKKNKKSKLSHETPNKVFKKPRKIDHKQEGIFNNLLILYPWFNFLFYNIFIEDTKESTWKSAFNSELHFCVTARRDTIVRTRLLAIGRQIPYANIDWSFFCVLEAISRPISNRWNRVASGTSGRPDVQFWKVRALVGIWSESWRMFQFECTRF